MQIHNLTGPATAHWSRPARAAAGAGEKIEDSATLSGGQPPRGTVGAAPAAIPAAGPAGLVASLQVRQTMERIATAGYVFRLGGEPIAPTPDQALEGLTVEPRFKPVRTNKWLDAMVQMVQSVPPERIRVSNWVELATMSEQLGGDHPLVRLERAGARLCLSDREVGALGALRTEEPLFLIPPGATAPSRLESLETAAYFVLGEGEPPDPLAARLKTLQESELSFLDDLNRSLGAAGAHARLKAGEKVTLALEKSEIATLQPGQMPPPDLDVALAYPGVTPGQRAALAIPCGLPLEERLALHRKIIQAEAAPRQGSYSLMSGTSMAGPFGKDWEETQRRNADVEPARTLARLWEGRLPGQELPTLAETYQHALGQGYRLRGQWAVQAAPHLLAHPEDRERLLALGAMGATSLEQTLEVDARLKTAEEREALGQLTRGQGPEPFERGLDALEHIQQSRWPDISLVEDARLTSLLVERFREDPLASLTGRSVADPMAVRARLKPGQVETFLREHALSGDVDSALLAVQPGGHPDLPEPLAVREQAWKAARPEFSAFGLPGAPNTAYQFLLGLPNRRLLEDVQTLQTFRASALDETEARALLADFKAGKLGRVTPEQVLQSLQTQLALHEERDLALAAVRAHGVSHEEQRRQVGLLQERYGPRVGAEWQALQAPLPPGEGFDQGLTALEKLGGVLDRKEALEAYSALAGSLVDGPWTGLSLQDGLERFLNTALVSGAETAMRDLELPPSVARAGGSLAQDGLGITVGGVRLRARASS